MERDAYVAALNRAKMAIEVYHGADSGEESLQDYDRAAYEGLGMDGPGERCTRRVLEKQLQRQDPVAQN